MNIDELKEYVAALPEDIKSAIKKSEIKHKEILETTSISSVFDTDPTVADLKEFLARFNDDAVVKVKASYALYDDIEVVAEIETPRMETDEELTKRIVSKVKRLEKAAQEVKLDDVKSRIKRVASSF